MNVAGVRWLVAAAGCAAPSLAYAYVDPGSAGLLVTSVLAAIAAAGYRLRRRWERIRRWLPRFRGGRPLKEPPAPAGGQEEPRPEDRDPPG